MIPFSLCFLPADLLSFLPCSEAIFSQQGHPLAGARLPAPPQRGYGREKAERSAAERAFRPKVVVLYLIR